MTRQSTRPVIIGVGITYTPARPSAPRRRPARARSGRVVVRRVERPVPSADGTLVARLDGAAPAGQALLAFAGGGGASLRDGYRREVAATAAEPRVVVEAMLAAGATLGEVIASTCGVTTWRVVGRILRDDLWFTTREVMIGAREAGLSDEAAREAAGMDVDNR